MRGRQGRKLTGKSDIIHDSTLGDYYDCGSFLVLSHCLHLKVMILKVLKVMIIVFFHTPDICHSRRKFKKFQPSVKQIQINAKSIALYSVHTACVILCMNA